MLVGLEPEIATRPAKNLDGREGCLALCAFLYVVDVWRFSFEVVASADSVEGREAERSLPDVADARESGCLSEASKPKLFCDIASSKSIEICYHNPTNFRMSHGINPNGKWLEHIPDHHHSSVSISRATSAHPRCSPHRSRPSPYLPPHH